MNATEYIILSAFVSAFDMYRSVAGNLSVEVIQRLCNAADKHIIVYVITTYRSLGSYVYVVSAKIYMYLSIE